MASPAAQAITLRLIQSKVLEDSTRPRLLPLQCPMPPGPLPGCPPASLERSQPEDHRQGRSAHLPDCPPRASSGSDAGSCNTIGADASSHVSISSCVVRITGIALG
jgi:hypothetical protein